MPGFNRNKVFARIEQSAPSFATGALIALAIAQLTIAGILWAPNPQEIHFRAIAKYCQELPNVRVQGPDLLYPEE